jgi:hypothetical protein
MGCRPVGLGIVFNMVCDCEFENRGYGENGEGVRGEGMKKLCRRGGGVIESKKKSVLRKII